jgi:hypothetical protein
MRDNPNIQGRFSGVNKMCQQCIKECKQFVNVTVLQCKFVSNKVEGGNLPLATKPLMPHLKGDNEL